MTKFVIGIGSQRAGSTLLHRVLDQCSPIYMNPVKELHYFDTLFGVRNENVLRHFSANQLNREVEQIVKAKDFGFITKRYKNELRANFLLATKKIHNINYIELYRPCVQGHKLLGEITPEYMILPEKGISKMRDVVGEDAKIILLARNPAKRFVSAFKLLMLGIPHSDMAVFEEQMLATLSVGGEWLTVQDAFNDYEKALGNYQKQFKSVLMLSYDELFSAVDETAEKLSDFLEIKLALPHYKKIVGTKVNALDETRDLSNETLALLEARYAEQQAYLDKVFGAGFCAA
ncbi:MAG: sulfotransferase [Methylovulum sp.]|nr:sulfotransferase [Methylovulum sp.]